MQLHCSWCNMSKGAAAVRCEAAAQGTSATSASPWEGATSPFNLHGRVRAGQQTPFLGAGVRAGALCAAVWGLPMAAIAPQRFLIPHLAVAVPAACSVLQAGIYPSTSPWLPHIRAPLPGRIVCQPLSWCQSAAPH